VALSEGARGKPLVERDRRERVALFESKFDTDLETLDRKFLAFMRTVQ
jgi:hypothetical protein